MRIILLALLPLLIYPLNPAENREEAAVKYIWEDNFTAAEKAKITTWLNEVTLATQKTLGTYPFTMNLYIHRSNGNEPVPWAETTRWGEQGVHFHVNTKYSLGDFKMDWTAAHEISHLSIPFVGRQNSWFSEGYASYWQWIILKNAGYYNAQEIAAKYRAKFNQVKRYYENNDSFKECATKLRQQHNYKAFYWGGACFFFELDGLLQARNSSLQQLIVTYQNQGRSEDENLEEVLASLDQIAGDQLVSKTYKMYTQEKAISTKARLEALAKKVSF